MSLGDILQGAFFTEYIKKGKKFALCLSDSDANPVFRRYHDALRGTDNGWHAIYLARRYTNGSNPWRL